MPGIDCIEWIVDKGSADDTVTVAKANGVDHVVRHTHNQGWHVVLRSQGNFRINLLNLCG